LFTALCVCDISFQNVIENLDGLAFLTNLRFLTAAHNCIENISGIADLRLLSFVDLSNNKISDTCKRFWKSYVNRDCSKIEVLSIAFYFSAEIMQIST